MKLGSYRFLPWLVVFATLPAFAQFEVNPDRFDDGPSSAEAQSVSRASAELSGQIAEQQSLLASYRGKIAAEAALVEQARQRLISPEGSADEAGESIALSVSEERLEKLQRSLADPIRVAETILAGLETRQAALMASATEHPPAVRRASRKATVLMASSRSASLYPAIHGGLSQRASLPKTSDAERLKHPLALNH